MSKNLHVTCIRFSNSYRTKIMGLSKNSLHMHNHNQTLMAVNLEPDIQRNDKWNWTSSLYIFHFSVNHDVIKSRGTIKKPYNISLVSFREENKNNILNLTIRSPTYLTRKYLIFQNFINYLVAFLVMVYWAIYYTKILQQAHYMCLYAYLHSLYIT